MARKNYRVDEVLRMLLKHPCIKLEDNAIEVSPSSNPDVRNTIGNGTRGKLDFLTKRGYAVIWRTDNGYVELFAKDKSNKKVVKDGDEIEIDRLISIDTEEAKLLATEEVKQIHPTKRKFIVKKSSLMLD